MTFSYPKALQRLIDFVLWGAVSTLVLAPVVSIATEGLPSKHIIQEQIVATCPAAETSNCLAAADLLQAMGSFYDTVIVVLLALLALIASLVYMSIKGASKRQIESQFEKDFESEWLQARIREKVNTATQAAIAELAQQLEILKNQIKHSQSQDEREERVPETMVVTGSNVGGDNNGAR